jgi:hypothetical protein
MKWLLVISLLMAVSAQGKEAPARALGDNIFESQSSIARMLPVDEEGDELLDQSNTAPTPIPEDTSLITTPEPDLLRQAQEEELNFDLEEAEKQKDKGPAKPK